MEQQADVQFDNLFDFYTKQALGFYKRNMGKRDHLDITEGLNMARMCNNLGELCKSKGYEHLALGYYEKAAFIGGLVVSDSLLVAWALDNIGHIYHNQGKLDDALKSYQKTLLIEERRVPNSMAVVISYENIGKILTLQGKSQEAMIAFGLAKAMGCHNVQH